MCFTNLFTFTASFFPSSCFCRTILPRHSIFSQHEISIRYLQFTTKMIAHISTGLKTSTYIGLRLYLSYIIHFYQSADNVDGSQILRMCNREAGKYSVIGFQHRKMLMVIYSRKLSGVSVLAIKIFLPTKRAMHR